MQLDSMRTTRQLRVSCLPHTATSRGIPNELRAHERGLVGCSNLLESARLFGFHLKGRLTVSIDIVEHGEQFARDAGVVVAMLSSAASTRDWFTRSEAAKTGALD
jgi:hypothetical protein